jgi:hypothetical protein
MTKLKNENFRVNYRGSLAFLKVIYQLLPGEVDGNYEIVVSAIEI